MRWDECFDGVYLRPIAFSICVQNGEFGVGIRYPVLKYYVFIAESLRARSAAISHIALVASVELYSR